MAEPEKTPAEGPVLARMIAAHARAPAPSPNRAPAAKRAFGRALRHAAAPFPGMTLTLGELDFSAEIDLLSAIEAQPDHGLLAALEDDAGRRGLVALSNAFGDALIEVQTTGRVEPGSLPPRPVTEIDEALCRDYLDLVLSAFTREAMPVEGRDWPLRMQFASRVRDRGQLNLLMPEGAYHLFKAEIAFEGTDRRAQASLVLPCDPTLVAPGTGAADQAPGPDPTWQAGVAATLMRTPLLLDAVLLRVTRSLGEVQTLQVGDVIPFAAQDLQSVALEDSSGRAVLTGRLGQLGGKRALRLMPDPQSGGRAAPDPPPAPTVSPNAAAPPVPDAIPRPDPMEPPPPAPPVPATMP